MDIGFLILSNKLLGLITLLNRALLFFVLFPDLVWWVPFFLAFSLAWIELIYIWDDGLVVEVVGLVYRTLLFELDRSLLEDSWSVSLNDFSISFKKESPSKNDISFCLWYVFFVSFVYFVLPVEIVAVVSEIVLLLFLIPF